MFFEPNESTVFKGQPTNVTELRRCFTRRQMDDLEFAATNFGAEKDQSIKSRMLESLNSRPRKTEQIKALIARVGELSADQIAYCFYRYLEYQDVYPVYSA